MMHDGAATNTRIDERVRAFISDRAPWTVVYEIASFITFDCIGMKTEQVVEAVRARWPKLRDQDLETGCHIAAEARHLRGTLHLEEADKLGGDNVVRFRR
jgi:hypothetical protein